MSKQTSGNRFNGKGYYIALGLCAFAIAISGFLYYWNASKPEPALRDPDNTVNVTLDPGGEVPVGVTTPNQDPQVTTTPTAPNQGTSAAKLGKTASPVAGSTVAEYAMDCLLYNQTTRDWRTHNGIDIAAETGAFVTAAADGTVYTVYEDETMGTTVVISHAEGYTTKYASLNENVLVQPGDTVTVGQQIGTVGQTALLESAIGDHVHFSVACNDVPVDPGDFLPEES